MCSKYNTYGCNLISTDSTQKTGKKLALLYYRGIWHANRVPQQQLQKPIYSSPTIVQIKFASVVLFDRDFIAQCHKVLTSL
jgi:hypothetical protein